MFMVYIFTYLLYTLHTMCSEKLYKINKNKLDQQSEDFNIAAAHFSDLTLSTLR